MEQDSLSREKGGGRELTHDYRHAGFQSFNFEEKQAA